MFGAFDGKSVFVEIVGILMSEGRESFKGDLTFGQDKDSTVGLSLGEEDLIFFEFKYMKFLNHLFEFLFFKEFETVETGEDLNLFEMCLCMFLAHEFAQFLEVNLKKVVFLGEGNDSLWIFFQLEWG